MRCRECGQPIAFDSLETAAQFKMEALLSRLGAAVCEAREAILQIRDIAEEDCGNRHSVRIVRLCESILSPKLYEPWHDD